MDSKIVEAYLHIFKEWEEMFCYLDKDGKTIKPEEKYRCWCLCHCVDVLSVTDPKKLTEEQFEEILSMAVKAALATTVDKDLCRAQHARILEMGLTTLPVTDYAQNRLKRREPDRV